MAEKNGNNKDSQTGQVTPKKYLKKLILSKSISRIITLVKQVHFKSEYSKMETDKGI